MIPDDTFWLWATLFLAVAASLWLERTRLGRRLSAPAFAISAGMLLANTGIIPSSSASYDAIGLYVVPIAIPLLLLDGDLRRIVRESGITFHAFLLGTLCTLAAAVAAFALVPLSSDLGAKLAGAFAATYIGGSMNLIAVSQAVGIPSDILAAAVAADNIVGSLYIALLPTLFSLPWLRRYFPPVQDPQDIGAEALPDASPPFKLVNVAGALALALIIAALATSAAQWLGVGYATVLISTALTVAIATFVPRVAKLFAGAFDLGLMGMMIFFVTVGAAARIDVLLEQGALILWFAFLVVALHLLLLLPIAALLRLPLRETLIGSCSNVTGPAVSAAIAASKGWRDLVVPGVLTGILGYIIGTFIGIALTRLLA